MSCQRVLSSALQAGDAVQATYHVRLEPLPRLVREAREFVAGHAPSLPPEIHDALLLLTSELVTNAVLHARTPLVLGLTVTDDSVLVTVHDLNLTRPEQQPYVQREGGWGLLLVRALAGESAMEPHDEGGKTAWFRLPRGALAPVEDDAAARPPGQIAPDMEETG